MWRLRTRSPKWEHVCTNGRYDYYDIKDRDPIVAHHGDGSFENATCTVHTGNWLSKTQRVEGDAAIVQSTQLGFSRSLGSATWNAANKSEMWHAGWTITARWAVLRLAQMKLNMKGQYFVLERCKQNAIFSGISRQNRSYLDNISTYLWYIVCFQQRHCSRWVKDENFKIILQVLQEVTPKFHSNSVSSLCQGWLQCVASVMQGPHCKITAAKNTAKSPLQNHRCENQPWQHFARIWDIKIWQRFQYHL